MLFISSKIFIYDNFSSEKFEENADLLLLIFIKFLLFKLKLSLSKVDKKSQKISKVNNESKLKIFFQNKF